MTEPAPIDILIPVYNGEPYLRPALESVLNQTRRPASLYVADDASTDATPDTLRDVLGGVAWAKVERNSKNLRGVGNFIHCTGRAAAPYFNVFNADDILEASYVERVAAVIAEHPDVNLIYANAVLIDSAGTVLGGPHIPASRARGRTDGREFVRDLMTLGQANFVTATVLKTSAYRQRGGTDAKLDTFHDYDCYLRVGAAGPVYGIAEPLARIRVHEQQWSHHTSRHDDGSTTALFEKLPTYEFMTDAERARFVELLCDVRRRIAFRWFREPGASLGQMRQARADADRVVAAWQQSGSPLARHVRRYSRDPRHLAAWLLSATTPGLWLLRSTCRLFRL